MSFKIRGSITYLPLLKFSWICHFISDRLSQFIIMYKRDEGGREGEIKPVPSWGSPTFFPAVEFIVLISPGAGKLSCMPMRILKMKLSFRSHTVVIHTPILNLKHYCIPSFSFYNNPLNAFKYGEGIATCSSKWNPDDL